ncbi:MAG TPA: hypothetical protein VIM02_11005, partial [Rhizomicrobium sp.]
SEAHRVREKCRGEDSPRAKALRRALASAKRKIESGNRPGRSGVGEGVTARRENEDQAVV